MSEFNLRSLQQQDDPFLQNFDSYNNSADLLIKLCQNELQQQSKMQQSPQEHSDSSSPKRLTDKKKIFYRDKMVPLLKPGSQTKLEYNYVPYGQKGKVPISKEEQLKRNRESAKISRQRKKQYMTILEQKNVENQKRIEELEYRLQQITLERDRLKQEHQTEIRNYLESKTQAYQQLQNSLNDPNTPDSHIAAQIGNMFVRFGAAGRDRVSVMNYYMNEIIQNLLSDIHKYFINSSKLCDSGIQMKKIDGQILRILQIDHSKVNGIIHKYKERFNKQACVFKNLTHQFCQVFQSIQNQGRVIENVYNDLARQLSIRKLGQLIVWFQEHKYCKEVKQVRAEWVEQLKKGEQVVDTLKKKYKK